MNTEQIVEKPTTRRESKTYSENVHKLSKRRTDVAVLKKLFCM